MNDNRTGVVASELYMRIVFILLLRLLSLVELRANPKITEDRDRDVYN